MKNFKLTIEYDGTNYLGWQRQATGPTVQAEIELALASITGPPITLIGAGRTDAGVHAIGQVANFHCETHLNPEPILKGLNSLLPPDIAIKDCQLAPESFHARFGAKTKIYDYCILNQKTRSPIGRNYVWFIHTPLDVDGMRRAADHFIGCHDFKAFENTGSPRANTVRTVIGAAWTEKPGQHLTFRIEADGFLRCMVRNIVGTLVAVGRGKLSPADVRAILDSRDRKRASATAPGRGLFLVRVKY